jgi:hypothetical protein
MAAAVAIVSAGMLLPVSERQVAKADSALDVFMPGYEFNEVHTRHIDATPERVYQAVRDVTAGEIRFFRALTWIRRFGRAGPEGILNAPERRSIVDVATSTTFLMLHNEPGAEVVIGTLVHSPPGTRRRNAMPTAEAFKALEDPGYAKAAMNFLIEPDGRGATKLSTETRVHATDDASRRRFAMYWRIIYPGSALIRREWLRAVERRAEGTTP